MPPVRTPGILLKILPYSETSLILKAYTRDSGSISFIAKGALRPKSPLHGLLDLFCVHEFVYRSRGKDGLVPLADACLLRNFEGLKSDLVKMATASLVLEIYLKYVMGSESAHPLFELLEHSLEDLNQTRIPPAHMPMYVCDFLIQFSSLTGYRPQFLRCVGCGTGIGSQPADFDLEMGGPVCRSCGAAEHHLEKRIPAPLLHWFDRLAASGRRAGPAEKRMMARGEQLLLNFLSTHGSQASRLKSLPFYLDMIKAS